MSVKNEDDDYQFVLVGGRNAIKPAAACTAQGRSYVMKQYHRQKQSAASLQKPPKTKKPLRDQQSHKQHALERRTSGQLPKDLIALEKLDPFASLAADTSELPALLANRELLPLTMLDS